MAGFFRNAYRKLLDTELGVLGEEIAEAQDQLDALAERFGRLQAKVGMRQLRSERKGEADPLVEELRLAVAARGRPAKPNGGEQWPETDV